ncbi:MAG: Rrf2 family transcriptional regulator [Rhizobiaceae bacterium]
MRLTLQTDHALRILITLGRASETVVPVEALARQFGASKNHLMKTAQALASAGFVASVRGRSGGIRLALPPETISIRKVVEAIEPDFHVAECFHNDRCTFMPGCRLRGLLGQARAAFLQTLGSKSLADLIRAG